MSSELWRERLRATVGGYGGPTAVARLAGMPLQNLKNHLSGRTKRAPLDDLKRLSDTCAVDYEWLAGLERHKPTIDEPSSPSDDLVPYLAHVPGFKAKPGKGFARYKVVSRALELAGYLPGDIIEFDLSAAPEMGEPVAVHLTDASGKDRFFLRLYHPPHLLAQTLDLSILPLQITPAESDLRLVGRFSFLVRAASTSRN